MKRLIWLTVLVMVVSVLVSPPSSQAGGSHVFFGVNVGVGPAYWGYGYGYRGYGYWGPRYWGPGVWWGPSAWWWGAPYYYPAPATVIQQPPVYVQPAPSSEEQPYWYYCQNPQGYYPYVKECPKGWMKVVPPAAPPGH